MLKQNKRAIQIILLLLDSAAIVLSFEVAYKIRLLPYFKRFHTLAPMDEYAWLLWIAVPVWIALLHFQGLYKSLRVVGFGALLWRLFKTVLIGTILSGSFIFLFQAKDFSRSLMGLFAFFNFVLLVTIRSSIKGIAHFFRKRGYNFRNVLIIGLNERTRDLIRRIRHHPEWNLKIVGILTINSVSGESAPEFEGVSIIGTIQDLSTIAKEKTIDEIIFTLETPDLLKAEDALQLCEELGIRTHLVMDFFNLIIAKTQFGYLEEIPLLTFTTTPFHEFHLLMKRVMDIVISFVLIILFLPVMIAVAILIKLDSPGPIFFKQTRVGLNGRKFKLLKFRSMVRDAEKKLDEVRALNEMSGPVFKAENDPRITRIGRFLRKYSLDELPQLFNVLKGDMSLVGPRPPIPEEVKKYKGWQRRRLSMKPGITCIWQVSGRNEVDFEEWMRMDLQYIDHWSLALDFILLFKTIPAVLTGRGAK